MIQTYIESIYVESLNHSLLEKYSFVFSERGIEAKGRRRRIFELYFIILLVQRNKVPLQIDLYHRLLGHLCRN